MGGRCCHQPKFQRPWIRLAGLGVVVMGPVVVFLALTLQHEFSWSPKMIGGSATSADSRVRRPSGTSDDEDAARESFESLCLSRSQHLKYRPPSQRISPSGTWEKAFRAYEKFHSECSRGRNWNLEFRTPIENSSRSGGCRVLVYSEGPAGLGNRLLSLTSAFLYSLLTKRVFLVDSRSHLATLLCEPFHESSWLLPWDFPFEEALDKASSLGEAAAEATGWNSTTKVVSLHLDHAQSGGDQLFFCSEIRYRLQSVPWLAWSSNQYYVPRFFTFPELWHPLVALFPNVSLAFTHLSRSLLLPSNPTWEKIVRIQSSYLTPADELVGIQIRRHSVPDSGEYDDAAFHRILDCLIGNKFLPNVSPGLGTAGAGVGTAMHEEESENILRVSFGTRSCPRPSGVNYAVLVTSLQLRFFEELRDLYANMATVDGSLVRVHMVSHEGMEWHSFDQSQKAFVEMWLLSMSDRIATSSWSTFGYIAQGLGAMRPLIVDLTGEISQQMSSPFSSSLQRHCYFGQSIEPCNHYTYYPAGSQCVGNQTAPSDVHRTWIRNFLRPCQDFPPGLQLVV